MKNILFFFAIILLTMSCHEEINDKIFIGLSDHESSKLYFAKALSKSLENEEIRRIIKDKSLERFNNDYDVLFLHVKDMILSDGRKMWEKIAEYSDDYIKLKESIESNPLLTILVPRFYHWSAESWNTVKVIPYVGVSNQKERLKGDKMKVFDSEGNMSYAPYNQMFTKPIIFVKDNDRLSVKNNFESARIKDNLVAYQDSEVTLVFDLPAYKNDYKELKKPTNARFGFQGSYDADLFYAYEAGSICPRDYVYYDILPPENKNSGPFNANKIEMITSIYFPNESSFFTVYDDITDGQLEFQFNIMAIKSNNVVEEFKRGYTCYANELFDYSVDNNGYFTVHETIAHLIGPKIPIISWDMKKYGDRWKLQVFEVDPTGNQIEYSINVKTTIGSNFNNNIKEGPVFGTSSTTTAESNYKIVVKSDTDDLYEANIDWCHDFITYKDHLLFGVYMYSGTDPFTGIVMVGIEPAESIYWE